jgi:hypothetical protein
LFSLGLGLDANANQNKETKAILTSMKLIKTITTHYYLLHDNTGFYTAHTKFPDFKVIKRI